MFQFRLLRELCSSNSSEAEQLQFPTPNKVWVRRAGFLKGRGESKGEIERGRERERVRPRYLRSTQKKVRVCEGETVEYYYTYMLSIRPSIRCPGFPCSRLDLVLLLTHIGLNIGSAITTSCTQFLLIAAHTKGRWGREGERERGWKEGGRLPLAGLAGLPCLAGGWLLPLTRPAFL